MARYIPLSLLPMNKGCKCCKPAQSWAIIGYFQRAGIAAAELFSSFSYLFLCHMLLVIYFMLFFHFMLYQFYPISYFCTLVAPERRANINLQAKPLICAHALKKTLAKYIFRNFWSCHLPSHQSRSTTVLYSTYLCCMYFKGILYWRRIHMSQTQSLLSQPTQSIMHSKLPHMHTAIQMHTNAFKVPNSFRKILGRSSILQLWWWTHHLVQCVDADVQQHEHRQCLPNNLHDTCSCLAISRLGHQSW